VSEFKEFWICDHGNWYDNLKTADEEQSESSLTHVIEYSAYKKLQLECSSMGKLMSSSICLPVEDYCNLLKKNITLDQKIVELTKTLQWYADGMPFRDNLGNATELAQKVLEKK
jgi:hypothetical protein